MSKIKELRDNPRINYSYINFLELVFGGIKTKYLETFIRLSRLETESDFRSGIKEEYLASISINCGIPYERICHLSVDELSFYYRMSSYFRGADPTKLKKFKKFIEYNERGLIKQNDVTRYSSFEEIYQEISKIEYKTSEKDLEKKIKLIYEDDEWIILRPLSYLSSLKYGASTKWCVASYEYKEHFYRYAQGGILVYVINKKTNLKIATYKSFEENRITFWDEVDKNIDSIESGVSFEILKIVQNELTGLDGKKPNSYYWDEKLKEQYLKDTERDIKGPTPTPWGIAQGDAPDMEMLMEDDDPGLEYDS